MTAFKRKYGISFSWKRFLGISGLKSSIAGITGIPTTKGGLERKIGQALLRMVFGKR